MIALFRTRRSESTKEKEITSEGNVIERMELSFEKKDGHIIYYLEVKLGKLSVTIFRENAHMH